MSMEKVANDRAVHGESHVKVETSVDVCEYDQSYFRVVERRVLAEYVGAWVGSDSYDAAENHLVHIDAGGARKVDSHVHLWYPVADDSHHQE